MMKQENQGTINSGTSTSIPAAKRKRGRPRKDDNMIPRESTLGMTGTASARSQIIDSTGNADNVLVGQVVQGVLDGSFDAGYLLTVKVGNTGTVLRGLVFKPGLSVPISSANDIAPHVKMVKREHIHLPGPNP